MTSDVSRSNEYIRWLPDRTASSDWLVQQHVDSMSMSPDSVLYVLERFFKKTVIHQNPIEPTPLRKKEQLT